MRALLQVMAATAQQSAAGTSQARQGIITSYDPASYAVKVQLQPTGEETGWIPLSSPWVGNGWGFAAGPMIGAVAEVDFDGGLPGAGMVTGQFYNDEDRCPGPPSGEFWLLHEKGAVLKFLNSGEVILSAAEKLIFDAPLHHFTGGDVLIEQNLKVKKNIFDWNGKYGAVAKIRIIYDGHHHIGHGSGAPSEVPDTLMRK